MASPVFAQFTIEQALSAPFASDLVAAPKLSRIAWVEYRQGKRNVRVAEAPFTSSRYLTQFNEDDGEELGQLLFLPDGSGVVFTRGGDLEMGREHPNPTSAPGEPKQQVWKVLWNGTATQFDGHSPAVSSTGSIAYLKGRDVYRDGKKWFSVKGSVSQMAWSPDGSQLAFANGRGDHGFIGVIRGGEITFLDPSVDRDTAPSWSPDGQSLAFVRIPASTRAFSFGPVREAEPWSILVANVANRFVRTVFTARPGPGSAWSPVTASQQLLWSRNGDLVFPWEQTGWRNLYRVNTNPGAAAPVNVTPGALEVEHVAQGPDGKICYSANPPAPTPADRDRRQVYCLGSASAVRPGTGLQWEPAPIADGSIAFLASSPRIPAHPAVKLASGEVRDLALDAIPADFPQAQFVEPKQVIFPAPDGLAIHAQVFEPPAGSGRRPATVFLHGGSRRQMLLGFHYKFYYSNSYALNQYLASRGFVVLSVNYRSGTGYGLNFREAEHYGATGASEFQDVLAAAQYLRSRADIDPARISLWGGSYGGYLTALGLARASHLFHTGVDIHGVHDWNNVIRNFVPAYNPQTQATAARVAFESSPLASVDHWKSPVLLIHGDDDRNVPFGETVRLAEALRKQKVPFEQLIFPDDVHDFLLHRNWLRAYQATAAYLERQAGLPPAGTSGR
jgi:dipeptidyl aminopeptidase/acylaminoacyl peptidase